MIREASSCDLKELVQKFIPEVIGKEIEKACQGLFPLQNVFLRKVKILKAPKFDLGKLLELHGEGSSAAAAGAAVVGASGDDKGSKVGRSGKAGEWKEPAVLESV